MDVKIFILIENTTQIYPLYMGTHCKDKMPKQIFPKKEYRGLSPNFHIHVSVSKLYIPTMALPFLLEEICGPILGLTINILLFLKVRDLRILCGKIS
jgi:hypothetical protein